MTVDELVYICANVMAVLLIFTLYLGVGFWAIKKTGEDLFNWVDAAPNGCLLGLAWTLWPIVIGYYYIVGYLKYFRERKNK
jgi:hypothetical protein